MKRPRRHELTERRLMTNDQDLTEKDQMQSSILMQESSSSTVRVAVGGFDDAAALETYAPSEFTAL